MKTVLASDPCEESCMQKLLISIRESGAIERSQAEADQHIDRALEALVGLPDCVEQRSLEDLAKYIIRRNM
jgi:geranylgeranyl pyrophosphate synthase